MKKYFLPTFILFLLIGNVVHGQCFSTVNAGYNHNIGLKPDNSIWSWGWGIWGALGLNSDADALTPTQIGTATNWQYIFPGSTNTFGIKDNGSLWATGGGDNGELGDGVSGLGHEIFHFIQIGTATNWKSISPNGSFTIGLRTDGTLWSWGINTFSQLGDGTNNSRSIPTQVGTATNWKSITTGSGFCIALKTDGTMWSWGSNASGALGINSLEIQSVPTPIQAGTDNDWKVVISGAESAHSLAIKNNGTLYSFGGVWSSGMGALGFGLNTTPQVTPAQIGTANDWQSVSVGFNNSFGIKTNGTLWAWGQNDYGQLGDGTTADRGFPVQIGIDTDWASVSAGSVHTVALKTNGSLWFWGDGTFAQQGNGAYSGSLVPVQVNVSGCALATESFSHLENEVVFSPNPTKNTITLHLKKPVKFNAIAVYDITGRNVKSITNVATENEITFNLSELATGLYNVVLKNNENIILVKKIIKE